MQEMTFQEMAVMVNEIREIMDRHNRASMNPEIFAPAVALLVYQTGIVAESLGLETKDDKNRPYEKWMMTGIQRNLMMLVRNPDMRKAMMAAIARSESEQEAGHEAARSAIVIPG